MISPRMLAKAVTCSAVVLAASAQIAAACPSYNNPTVFGTASLAAGFLPDPIGFDLTAGGTVDLSGCTGGDWSGFVVTRPDFRLLYSGTSPTGQLTFALEARSDVDTVLLINAPDGTWHYNDDYRNTDSAIVFVNPLPGQYDVWTGSYAPSSNNPAQLIVTEINY